MCYRNLFKFLSKEVTKSTLWPWSGKGKIHPLQQHLGAIHNKVLCSWRIVKKFTEVLAHSKERTFAHSSPWTFPPSPSTIYQVPSLISQATLLFIKTLHFPSRPSTTQSTPLLLIKTLYFAVKTLCYPPQPLDYVFQPLSFTSSYSINHASYSNINQDPILVLLLQGVPKS